MSERDELQKSLHAAASDAKEAIEFVERFAAAIPRLGEHAFNDLADAMKHGAVVPKKHESEDIF